MAEQLKIPPIQLKDIPQDVLLVMMQNLEGQDDSALAALCMVDKNFNQRICGDEYWYGVLKRRLGLSREYVDFVRGNNSLPALYRYFTDAPLVPPALPPIPPEHAGFKTPILLSDDMRDFIRNGNFGPSNPNDPRSLPLNQLLMVGQNGIATRAILIPLFSIYARINNMQDPADGSMVKATPEMYRYLSNTFARLGFDQDTSFKHARIQSIITDNVIKRNDLTPEQARILSSPGIIIQLDRDKSLVSNVLTAYREDFDNDDIETLLYLRRQTPDILASIFPNKEIGKNIMLRYDQERFCQNLNDNNDIGNLRGVAIKLGVAYDANTTKAELCDLISQQFARGRIN